ncbi:hypothetical protein GCM10018781_33110 [Kitasatospora indigofera]|uniref:Uncharacterized protein n=1 Tax=Kitasatospora indigofera TaxID=67307 RepID=A0A919KT70_9ACTN|nr:hypothetical protein [Kitasatospora indigofera]GHH71623.1 hypothetical protein GCM10018781_33110 [Kitasatospora indigofera]
MNPFYFQVSVPTRNTVRPEQRGLHVFTGPAETGAEAVRIARRTCEAALAAHAAGTAVPRRQPDGWGARGVRPGWSFDWADATVVSWECDSFLRSYDVRDHLRPDGAVTR